MNLCSATTVYPATVVVFLFNFCNCDNLLKHRLDLADLHTLLDPTLVALALSSVLPLDEFLKTKIPKVPNVGGKVHSNFCYTKPISCSNSCNLYVICIAICIETGFNVSFS